MRADFTTNLAAQAEAEFLPSGAVYNYHVVDGDHCSESTPVYTRRRKPKGWLPPEPYQFNRVKYQRHSGLVKTEVFHLGLPVSSVEYKGCVGGSAFNSLNTFDETLILSDVSLSSHRDRALIKARLAMKDSKINLGVAFAERNRTAKLMGDTAMQLVNAVRQLRRGNFSGAAKALGVNKPKQPRGSSVTSRWLELQYGWKPLLNDVYGSAHALAERENSDWIVTGKGSSKIKLDRSAERSHSGYVFDAGVGTVRGTAGVYVRIDAVPQNDLLQSFAALGITNPALIGWELVPFSFVVDWFLPIGSFIDSLDAMLGYGPTWCSISELKRCRWVDNLASDEFSSGDWLNVNTRQASGSKEEVQLVRTVQTSVPLPSMPRLKDPRSLGHMANGLSLLASVFGGRR